MSTEPEINDPESCDQDWISIYDESSHSESRESLIDNNEIKTRVSENKGCIHYSRNCKIIAPCCKEVFWCRHCHNEFYETQPSGAHEIDRFEISEIICARCDTRQSVSNTCVSCKEEFATYYCSICKLWDNKGQEKKNYHCELCGICRVGGRENYFHCKVCDTCYPNSLENNHVCIEKSMKSPCSICLEDMFNCVSPVSILGCGHTIHVACLKSLQGYRGLASLRCPLCMKSLDTDGTVWKWLDTAIANNPLPSEDIRDIRIRCYDCALVTLTKFHFFGLKCVNCGSYNTVTVNNLTSSEHNNETQPDN